MSLRGDTECVLWVLILFTMFGCIAGGGIGQVVGAFTLDDAGRIEALTSGAGSLGAAGGFIAAILLLGMGGDGGAEEEGSDQDEAE